MTWRKRWDSNPRVGLPTAGFQDRCLKPLGHSSSAGPAGRAATFIRGRVGFRPVCGGVLHQVQRGSRLAARDGIVAQGCWVMRRLSRGPASVETMPCTDPCRAVLCWRR